jgi:hypothetical protein
MVNKTYIGGDTNNANSPSDWSPAGVPLPGDVLSMDQSSLTPPLTINIRGNDLAGDTIDLGGNAFDTLNLSHNAQVSAVLSGFHFVQVNVAGKDTFNLSFDFSDAPHPSNINFNLQPHAVLTAAFATNAGGFTVNGGAGSKLINDQADVFNGSNIVITPDVIGVGSFTVASGTAHGFPVPGNLEFVHSVAKGETVTLAGGPTLGGQLKIDQPKDFHASVHMQNGSIDLVGLANADSYSLHHDLLTIYANDKVIDKLRITNDSNVGGKPQDLVVAKSSSDVFVTLNSAFADNTVLPLHHSL